MLRSFFLAILLTMMLPLAHGEVQALDSPVPQVQVDLAQSTEPEAPAEEPSASGSTASGETYRLKSEKPRNESADMGTASVQMTLGLLAVLAVIFGLSWLARRFNVAGVSGVGGLKVSAALSVGPKEKVMVVEVEDRRLLIGVTPHQITLLQELGEAPASAPATDFAHRMQSLLKTGSLNDK